MSQVTPDTRGIAWDDGLDCWTVSDPGLARQVLNHPGFSSQTFDRSYQLYMTDAARQEFAALTEFLRLWFVQADGAEHTALRRPVQHALSASYFRSLGPWIEEVVDDCLDELARSRPADVVTVVADGVSARVMSHVVGIEEGPRVLRRWSRTLSAFIGAMYRRDYAQEAHTTMLEMAEGLARSSSVRGFPWGTPQERARTTATWAMNLFGGLETTSSLLGSVVLTALGETATWDGVREDRPGFITELVETVLERRPPLRHLGRVVAVDQDFAGAQLKAGDLVLVSLVGGELLGEGEGTGASAAASGCPVAKPSGDRHLVFGFGPHYCIGAPLARLEAATVLRRLGQRFPDARLAENAEVWGTNLSYVGLDHLYVELGPERTP